MKNFILLPVISVSISLAANALPNSCGTALERVNQRIAYGDITDLRPSLALAVQECQSEIDPRDANLYSSLLSRCRLIDPKDITKKQGQADSDDADISKDICTFHATAYVMDLHPKISEQLELVPAK